MSLNNSGSIHVDWENGSTLAVVFGEDHVMKAEEGAAWNGQKRRGR